MKKDKDFEEVKGPEPINAKALKNLINRIESTNSAIQLLSLKEQILEYLEKLQEVG